MKNIILVSTTNMNKTG